MNQRNCNILDTKRNAYNLSTAQEDAQSSIEEEGIDAGRIQESSESVSADLNSEIEAEGYSPEQLEANAAELDDFFSTAGTVNPRTTQDSLSEVSRFEEILAVKLVLSVLPL